MRELNQFVNLIFMLVNALAVSATAIQLKRAEWDEWIQSIRDGRMSDQTSRETRTQSDDRIFIHFYNFLNL